MTSPPDACPNCDGECSHTSIACYRRENRRFRSAVRELREALEGKHVTSKYYYWSDKDLQECRGERGVEAELKARAALENTKDIV